MQSPATATSEYLASLPEDRRAAMQQLRDIINQHTPEGFEEIMAYGMISWVVPHSIYPEGYHCNPRQPLPFISIASQKNFIALYHMGMYADAALHDWFVAEYPKHVKTKLDMGKSCIRFKKPDAIPYGLIGQLVSKVSVQDWIAVYEAGLKR